MATHRQYRNPPLIEALRQLAPRCRSLRRIISVLDDSRMDLAFIVKEPLYEAETEVIPLFQHALSLTQSIKLDFVVMPERLSKEFESQPGATVVYEYSPRPPR